jgi:hypothetical protein
LNNLVSSGLLSREKALELRERNFPELAQATVRGWIRLSPAIAKKQLDDGKWDGLVSGDTKYTLYREVHTAEDAIRTQAERNRIDQERAKKAAQNGRQTDYLKEIFLTGTFDAKKVLDDKVLDSFGSGSKEELIKMADAYNRAGGKMKSDPSTVINLFKRIHAPESDPTRITDENDLNPYFIDGKLSPDSLNMLRSEFAGRKTTDGANIAALKSQMLKGAEQAIVKKDVMGMVDPDGPANYTRFMADFISEWDEKIRSGIPARKLVDPKAPEYMGDRFRSYVKGFNEKLEDMTRFYGGKPPVANPMASPTPNSAPSPAVPTPTPGAARKRKSLDEIFR